MSELPSIIMSSLDHQRLDSLLANGASGHVTGIEALAREMDRAAIVEPTEIPPGVVTMNSTVRFIDDASGREFRLTLVYPDAAGPEGTVSVLAPVGSALLGLSVGQSIDWKAPGGRTLIPRVLEVVRQPEAMGEYHR